MGSWYAHIYNPVWPNRNPVKFPVVTYILRWILKILHDLKYLIHWELWYYGKLGSCRIVSINSRTP